LFKFFSLINILGEGGDKKATKRHFLPLLKSDKKRQKETKKHYFVFWLLVFLHT